MGGLLARGVEFDEQVEVAGRGAVGDGGVGAEDGEEVARRFGEGEDGGCGGGVGLAGCMWGSRTRGRGGGGGGKVVG